MNLRYGIVSARGVANATCTVRCTLLGKFLILAAATGTADIHQVTLSLQDHIRMPSAGSSTAVQYLRQQEAWAQIKDGLALPIKTALCKAAGLPVPMSLLLLPSELQQHCLQFLEVRSLLTCTAGAGSRIVS